MPGLPRVRDRLPQRRGVSRADRRDTRQAALEDKTNTSRPVHALDVLPRVRLSDAIEAGAFAGATDAEDRIVCVAAEVRSVQIASNPAAKNGADAVGDRIGLGETITRASGAAR